MRRALKVRFADPLWGVHLCRTAELLPPTCKQESHIWALHIALFEGWKSFHDLPTHGMTGSSKEATAAPALDHRNHAGDLVDLQQPKGNEQGMRTQLKLSLVPAGAPATDGHLRSGFSVALPQAFLQEVLTSFLPLSRLKSMALFGNC